MALPKKDFSFSMNSTGGESSGQTKTNNRKQPALSDQGSTITSNNGNNNLGLVGTNNSNSNTSTSSGSSFNVIEKPTNNSDYWQQLYEKYMNNYGSEMQKYLDERLNYLKTHSYTELMNSNLMANNARWQAMKNTNNILKAQGYGSQGMVGSNQASIQNAYLNALQNYRSDYANRNLEYDLAYNQSMMDINQAKNDLYGDYLNNMIDRENSRYDKEFEMWYQQQLANQQHQWDKEQQEAEWDREDQQNDELAQITQDDSRVNLIIQNIASMSKEQAKEALIADGIMNEDGTWNTSSGLNSSQLALVKSQYNMLYGEGESGTENKIKDYLETDGAGNTIGWGDLGTNNEVSAFIPENAFSSVRGYYDSKGNYVENTISGSVLLGKNKIEKLIQMPKYSDSELKNQDSVIEVKGETGTLYLAYIKGEGYLTVSKSFYNKFKGNKISI